MNGTLVRMRGLEGQIVAGALFSRLLPGVIQRNVGGALFNGAAGVCGYAETRIGCVLIDRLDRLRVRTRSRGVVAT